jgi:hypothetical protein
MFYKNTDCAEHAGMRRTCSKMLTKKYFDFHTKYLFTIVIPKLIANRTQDAKDS